MDGASLVSPEEAWCEARRTARSSASSRPWSLTRMMHSIGPTWHVWMAGPSTGGCTTKKSAPRRPSSWTR
eukprot:5068545-Amphidinium_carterae.1